MEENKAELNNEETDSAVSEAVNTDNASGGKGKKIITGILKVIGKILLIALETVLILVIAVYGVMYILAKGPSPTARSIFVMSVRETSAIGFLADWFFTEEEIAQIEAANNEVVYVETDTSLVDMSSTENLNSAEPDAWGLVDEDGDGIIVEEIHGEAYSGYMMVVLDPSRVIVGCDPEGFGKRSHTVAEFVEMFDAVAGINAGGFVDTGGLGNGNQPDGLVVFEGQHYFGGFGTKQGFVGFDDKHVLHVGTMSGNDVKEANIQYGVSFGPPLIKNGIMEDQYSLWSGMNPRTAIGQRSDGAVLLLVIDGRQVISLGATYQDLADIMMSYGAVNACNLDGGSSSLMWWQGDYINNCASVIGIRTVPTTFLVLKEGQQNG